MLVPFYFLVGQWGGPDRVAAAMKMVIYTLVGSLLMLAGAVATAVLSHAGPGGTISLRALRPGGATRCRSRTQKWIFITFALAFLIKMPAFPFHGWMPDAYRTMPLPALAFFSGVVSKVAAYGFLRLVLPLFPAATEDFHEILLILAVISILYGSIQAFTQTNARLILGYSSVAQLGFITLGIFALDAAGQGAQGALLQAVNHGLVVAPLFFVIALLAERAEGSEDIRDYGGIAFRAPVLAVLFLIVGAGDAGDARLGELRGRVPDPARHLQLGAGDRVHRVDRRGAGLGLRAAHVHPLDAQPRRAEGRVLRSHASATGSCSCRWCWRSSPSRSTPSSRWTRARRPSSRRCRRCSDDRSARPGDRQGSADQLGGAVPAIALTAGACIVLLVGLARSAFIRRSVVPVLTLIDAGRDRRARRSGSGTSTRRSSPTRWSSTT